MEMRILIGQDVGFDVAEGRLGLVFDAVVERLDDIFLEVRGSRPGSTWGLLWSKRISVVRSRRKSPHSS
jgi:hypothetical protein